MMVYTHASSVNFVKFVIGCAWYFAIYLLAVRIVLLQSPAIMQCSPLSAIFTASSKLVWHIRICIVHAYSSINCIKTSKIKRAASENPRASAVSGGHMALPTATAQLSTEYFTVSFTYCVPQPAPDAAILYTCKSTKLLLQNPWSASQQACWVCLLL